MAVALLRGWEYNVVHKSQYGEDDIGDTGGVVRVSLGTGGMVKMTLGTQVVW